jgi:CheY-like chemotaxis protein
MGMWDTFSKVGSPEGFWKPRWWIPGVKFEQFQIDAFGEMHKNPNHLLFLCRNTRMLSLACELASMDDVAPDDETTSPAKFATCLLSRACDVMDEAMDSGESPARLWSTDRWWQPQGWQEVALRLTDRKDRIQIARWIAPVDPLTAQRLLKPEEYDIRANQTDPLSIDLGKHAFQLLSNILDSSGEPGSWDDPVPQLVALVAQSANPTRPDRMKRLRTVVGRLVPSVLRSATYDWLNIISASDLPGFCESLIFSKSSLVRYAGEFGALQPDKRTKRLIFLIDDDPAMLELGRLIIMNRFGQQVRLASISGEAGALILASILEPDLILTDVSEPGMDGFIFAHYLKDNPLTGDIPFVFLTARAQRIDVIHGTNVHGAKDYITKPYSPQDLVASIQKVLGLEPDR